MKKLSAIIIAIALVFGLSQCKKDKPATPDAEDGMVYVTVNVANNGAKHEVYPSTGTYVFENGDKLYVGNNGHYIGTLTYNNGAFSGGITSPSTSDYLHFYFVGGLTTTPAELTTGTTSCTVSIADQSSKLPILSYGQSTQQYTDANATYTTTLRNKCGLVKFVPQVETNNAVTISGFYNTAAIDFATPSITPTGAPGDITLFAESDAAKWAILLPQTGVSPTATISGYFCEIEGTFDITNNYYNSTGVSISMTPPATFTASIDSYQIGEFSWDDKFPGDGDHSRTTLDPYTREVSFSAGDQISILSTQNTKKRFTTASGGATATFTGAAKNDSKFYAISPFRDDNITLSGDFISGVTIPDYQWSDNWGSGGSGQSWDPAAPLAYAVTEGENLQFHNLCAILKIRATGGWAGYFRILAFGGDLAGTFDLYTPTGELISSNSEVITITAGSRGDYSHSILASDRVLYICIAPGEYYDFTVCASYYYSNNPFIQKTKSDVTFEAGKIYDLGEFHK